MALAFELPYFVFDMRMLKICVICFFLVIGNMAHAQDIKTNLLAPFSISYEHFFSNHKALQGNLQFKPMNLIGESTQWLRIGAEYRVYKTRKIGLLDKHLHQQRGKFYAAYVRYGGFRNEEVGILYYGSKLSFGVIAGYKRYHFKKYIGEVYGGVGISPWVSTSNSVLAPKRDMRLELNLGISLGQSYRKKKDKK